jgi:GAF domain-containing protein
MPGNVTPFCSLDEVIVAPAPGVARAGSRSASETEAFLSLSGTLAHKPELASQRLVELAMKLAGADSAGLSLEDHDERGPFLRWIATTGEMARYVNGTMPREFSPCGTAIDHRHSLLMRDPVRYYAYISQLHAPVCTVMLVPFARAGKLIGTVWVVAHTVEKTFTADDLRVVEDLATFASSVLDAVASARIRH